MLTVRAHAPVKNKQGACALSLLRTRMPGWGLGPTHLNQNDTNEPGIQSAVLPGAQKLSNVSTREACVCRDRQISASC